MAIALSLGLQAASCVTYDRGADASRLDARDDDTAGEADAPPTDAGDDVVLTDATEAGVCDQGQATDYCSAVPALPADPVIDGVIDCGLRLEVIPDENFHQLFGTLPPSVIVSYAAGWRPGGLYLFVRVAGWLGIGAAADQPAWCGDDVELFADDDGVFSDPPNYDARGTSQFIITPPLPGETRGTRAEIYSHGESQGPWRASQWVSVRNGDLYDVEAFITPQDLNVLNPRTNAPGDHVGFNVVVSVGLGDVDAGSCNQTRAGQFALHYAPTDAGCGWPSCDVGTFCLPTLEP